MSLGEGSVPESIPVPQSQSMSQSQSASLFFGVDLNNMAPADLLAFVSRQSAVLSSVSAPPQHFPSPVVHSAALPAMSPAHHALPEPGSMACAAVSPGVRGTGTAPPAWRTSVGGEISNACAAGFPVVRESVSVPHASHGAKGVGTAAPVARTPWPTQPGAEGALSLKPP